MGENYQAQLVSRISSIISLSQSLVITRMFYFSTGIPGCPHPKPSPKPKGELGRARIHAILFTGGSCGRSGDGDSPNPQQQDFCGIPSIQSPTVNMDTLPETNRHSLLKIDGWKIKLPFLLGKSHLFRCVLLVSGRVIIDH